MKDIIQKVLTKYKDRILFAYLFGSHLQGTTSKSSDSDIAVFLNAYLGESYFEAFDILGKNGILDPEFAYSFAKIAGFRNFLGHDYGRIEASVICGKVIDSIPDVRKYILQIQKNCIKANH